MGRVNRLMERRVLRRAADQALMTPAYLRPLETPATTPSTAPSTQARQDDDADPWSDEPDTDARQRTDTEPIALAALHERLRRAPDDLLDETPAIARAADSPASAPIGTWKPDLIEPRRVRVVRRRYGQKAATATLAGLAVAAIAVSAALLVSRGAQQATSVTPEVSTTASQRPSTGQPAAGRVPPAPENAPAAPPPSPTPAPAPPSVTPASPPPVWRNNDSWTPSPPSPTKKPEFGVTRAPISATPPPPPAPGTNSATPGDGRRPHWGPW